MSETSSLVVFTIPSFIFGCIGVAITFNKQFAYRWVRWDPRWYFFTKSGESEENIVRAMQRFFGPLIMIMGFGITILNIVIAVN
ncbi:MAG: hypothetical protein GY861_23280 [bacterium]|nr:hypothetical protein [bacterium]